MRNPYVKIPVPLQVLVFTLDNGALRQCCRKRRGRPPSLLAPQTSVSMPGSLTGNRPQQEQKASVLKPVLRLGACLVPTRP